MTGQAAQAAPPHPDFSLQGGTDVCMVSLAQPRLRLSSHKEKLLPLGRGSGCRGPGGGAACGLASASQ